jgi:ferredoxin
MAGDGKAEVIADPVPESAKGAAAEARDNCPVSVISVQ